uniref:GPI alpha-1,4-mannosyltransferase I, catalytic subunit n=1 Tax=Cyprinus carpio TaxID=7962 RepID=A0A8C2HLG0_CYPCA
MDAWLCVMFSVTLLIRLALLCFGVYQDQNLRWVHCGKLLFLGSDLLSALLLFRLLVLHDSARSLASVHCSMWLFNPLTMAVSTCGNAESLLAVLIYPVTYALPVALSLVGAPSHGRGLIQNLVRCFSRDLLLFAAVSGAVFFSLTFYCMYGWDFLQESSLFHLTHRDIHHNFSPYFSMLYVTAEHHWSSVLVLVCFLLQLLLLLLSSLAFCCSIHTAVFVRFNKVCTSQMPFSRSYFLWYLCLLMLVLSRLTLSLRRGLGLLLWFVGQELWLSHAYYLEFEGCNSFALIWIAGLLFLLINSLILGQIISHYRPAEAQLKKTD